MPRALSGILFALLTLVPTGSDADRILSRPPANAARLGFEYTIAFWTVPFGRTSFETRLDRSSYVTSSHFETSGIISAFWQSTIDASSNGTISAREISPALYDSYYRRGSKHQRVRLTYAAGAIPVTYADPPYNLNRYPVTDAEKKEGLDPLGAATAVLAGMHSSASNPCGTVAAVFDGRRRYFRGP